MCENTIKVTPDRLRVIVGLGLMDNDCLTEALEISLGMGMNQVIEALDGLIEAGVVADVEGELLGLTEYGTALFTAIDAGMRCGAVFVLGKFVRDDTVRRE